MYCRTDVSRLSGLRSILSGPAGGVVGYANTCYDKANAIPIIGFDMVIMSFAGEQHFNANLDYRAVLQPM